MGSSSKLFYVVATFAAISLQEVNSQTTTPVGPLSRCPLNETYMTCSTRCERTCGKINEACPAVCDPPKCQCSANYYRNTAGKCVLHKDCNSTIPSPSPSSCSTVQCTVGQKCVVQSPPQCSRPPCQPAPQCVPINNTPNVSTPKPTTQCPVNETFMTCSSRCERTCGKTNQVCPAVCDPPKCQCSVNYFRNTSGKCVLQNDCNVTSPTLSCTTIRCSTGQKCVMQQTPQCVRPPCPTIPQCVPINNSPNVSTPKPTTQCPVNETFMTCSSRCERSCGKTNQVCPTVCDPPKCQCSANYFRNTAGKCVLQKDCNVTSAAPSCKTVRCAAGQKCVVQPKVQCLRPPCQPQAQCVPIHNSNNTTNASLCAHILCLGGQKCVMKAVKCIGTTKCKPAPTCSSVNGNVTAKTCNTIRCLGGQKCVLKQLKCVRNPCETVATCERKTTVNARPSCADIQCLGVQKCVMKQVKCNGAAVCNTVPSCHSANGNVTAKTCNTIRCLKGKQCVMKQLKCNKAPCDSIATCETKHNGNTTSLACRGVKCSAGKTCKVMKPLCMGCKQIGRCVDIDSKENSKENDSKENGGKCGPQEKMSTCKECEKTCADVKEPQGNGNHTVGRSCLQRCRKGCACDEGLFRDTVTGKCIPRMQCPAIRG